MAFFETETKLFQRQKEQCLSGVDLSRKGSVDAAILELVNYINAQQEFFTTSCCSGRVIVVDNTDEEGDVQKRGCQWLYVTHEEACCQSVKEGLNKTKGAAVFKFEPMVMHIQVQSLSYAQRLHTTAVASGFRNSGISIGGKGKIIVAVRSTHSLEAPLSCNGKILVTDDYIEHLTQSANRKMEENRTRIDRFFDNLRSMVENPQEKQTKGKRAKTKEHQHPPCLSSRTESQGSQVGPTENDTSSGSFHQIQNLSNDNEDLCE